jgi:actin-related protein
MYFPASDLSLVRFFENLKKNFFLFSKVDFSATELVITEPVLNFTSIQECMEEIVFEEYGFDSLIRINGMVGFIADSV